MMKILPKLRRFRIGRIVKNEIGREGKGREGKGREGKGREGSKWCLILNGMPRSHNIE